MKRNTKPKYVYLYKDKDGVPYYVGQGSTMRALAWQKKPFSWEHIPPYNGNTLHWVAVDLTNSEADELEELVISEIGRKDLNEGPLLNRTNGGGGRRGYLISDEERKVHSEHAKRLHAQKIIGSYKDRTV